MGILDALTFLLFVKVLVVILLFVYLVFAMLMMRQIIAMTKSVMMQDDYIIRILGVLHFALAGIVWVISLFLQTR